MFEGTGLGLAITRRLIEWMGGVLWGDSEAGQGLGFGFRVTLQVAEPEALPRPPVTLRRALLVGGQFISRTILERQLVPCGIAVTLCRSGVEALAGLARDGAYDMLLIDHEMPGMGRLTLAASLREAGHQRVFRKMVKTLEIDLVFASDGREAAQAIRLPEGVGRPPPSWCWRRM